MKQNFTVITSERISAYDSMPHVYRVSANNSSDVYEYYRGMAVFIFEGHPPLEGEKDDEDFLKVIDIPSPI